MAVTIRGSGQIINQIVQTSYSTYDSTTSTSFVSTGATATITPTSASNKILVMVSFMTQHAGATGQVLSRMMRGSSAAFSGTMGDFYQPSGSGVSGNINQIWLDSPATTSATTYTLQILSANAQTVGINRDFNGATTGVTYITLMEISG